LAALLDRHVDVVATGQEPTDAKETVALLAKIQESFDVDGFAFPGGCLVDSFGTLVAAPASPAATTVATFTVNALAALTLAALSGRVVVGLIVFVRPVLTVLPVLLLAVVRLVTPALSIAALALVVVVLLVVLVVLVVLVGRSLIETRIDLMGVGSAIAGAFVDLNRLDLAASRGFGG